jgi:DNA-binding response OmpR family regulator
MPKVLLVDTEPLLFALLKTKLEREGFEVLTNPEILTNLEAVTTSGEAQSIEGVLPDLIILGKYHPTFVLPKDNQTPIIFLSPSDTEELSELPHLKLPFRPNDLVELARKAVAVH